MPIYEYTCTNEPCSTRTEKLISNISYRPPTIECPACGAEAKLAISTPANPQFKGTGFHSTDYGK